MWKQVPELAVGQNGKEITHNEALRILRVLATLCVKSLNVTSPPAAPVEGDAYIVPTGASGAWAGKATQLAFWSNGAWVYLVPEVGWRVDVADSGTMYRFGGAGWTQMDGLSQPFIITGFIPGHPEDNATLVAHVAVIPITLAAGLPNTRVKALVPPAAAVSLTLRRNGNVIGTIQLAPDGTTTISFPSTVNCVAGDLVDVMLGATDASLSGLVISLYATR